MKPLGKLQPRTQSEIRETMREIEKPYRLKITARGGSRYVLMIGRSKSSADKAVVVLHKSKPVGFIEFEENIDQEGDSVQVVSLAYLMYAHRGLGIMTQAYRLFSYYENEVISSDGLVSDDAIKLWKRLMNMSNNNGDTVYRIKEQVSKMVLRELPHDSKFDKRINQVFSNKNYSLRLGLKVHRP